MVQVRLNNVRLAFDDLWVAKPYKAGDEPKFGATFLFPPGHPAEALVNAAVKEAAATSWGDDADDNIDMFKDNPNKCCFGKGDKKKKYDGFAGNLYIAAKNTTRPTVLDTNKAPLTKADGKPYGGCYVNAIIDVWAQKGEYAGIRASLQGVQYLRDGDAFSGGQVADTDDFEDLSDGADAPDMGGAATGGFA